MAMALGPRPLNTPGDNGPMTAACEGGVCRFRRHVSFTQGPLDFNKTDVSLSVCSVSGRTLGTQPLILTVLLKRGGGVPHFTALNSEV